jgi:hypothetical protein
MNSEYWTIKNTDEMKQWILRYSKLPLNVEFLEALAKVELKNLIEAKLEMMRKSNLTPQQLESILQFYFMKR